jgi:aryl-phospho-beta-D-glucosidase BglC (GH1 family)
MITSNIAAKNRSWLGLALACLLMLPTLTFAQLPTPTYGWNLGNTLEAVPTEGAWGPAATQNLINAVADAGFNTIRIPCAWDIHANQSTLQIDPAWMARVKQVVDWCYARNLYVVLNIHWDGGWLDNNIGDSPDPVVTQKMNAYWTQIATTFVGYDDHLLFAGANEPPAHTAAEVATLMNYYQTFINAVRATGGNNSTRWLVIQGPNTNIDITYDMVNTLPSDSASGRLMVEIHHYPFPWSIMTKDETWGKMFYFWGQGYHSPTMLDRNSTWGEEAYTDEQFQKMATKFVNRGVPVIIGEWGAVKRTGYPDLTGTELNRHLASRTYYSKTITDKANALGLKPIWWDAGGTGSNTMWLFDRSTAAIIDADNINALTGGPALPPPTPETVLQQNLTGGGTKGEVKSGATLSQSFVHPGSGTYQATKVTLHVSRKSSPPNANLVVYLGTAHGGGTIAGTTVNIAPSSVANKSGGSSWQTLDIVFASPVTLNKATTYYLNVTSATAGTKPYFVDVGAADTYANGFYTGTSGGSRDMWFQVWGQ